MEDTESDVRVYDQRVVVRSKKKLSKTQRNVIIGVMTVVGLGLTGFALSVLRREKPKKKRKDEDVETLESVLGDGESNLPLQAQVQRTKLANLDNDEPDHEVVNRKRNARRSKYADSFSEIVSDDDITKDGEMYVNQDPVGRRDRPKEKPEPILARHDTKTFTARKGKQLSVSESGGFNIKGMAHAIAENRGKHHDEDEEEHHHTEHHNHTEHHHPEHHHPEHHHTEHLHMEQLSNSSSKHSSLAVHVVFGGNPVLVDRPNIGEGLSLFADDLLLTIKEEADTYFLCSKELTKTDSSASSEKLPLFTTQKKKPRRTRSVESKQGRKTKVASGEEKLEKRKPPRTHSETVGADKEVIFNEAGRWESVNGYKVLRATTSKIPTFAEAMHKLEADGTMSTTNLNGGSVHLVREFERERAETEKAQNIWDGKHRTRKRTVTEGNLQIKSSVVSSVTGAEETPEGVKVREVVMRSTLLPIPSGDESEVHSSVYNVRETEKGLKVEEVVTRTKLLPAKGDFTLSDQQLLTKQRVFRRKPTREDVLLVLPQLLRVVAVLVTLFSVLIILFPRKRIPLPFFH